MIKILIADDHSIVHEGLKNILKENLFVCKVASVFSGDKILEVVKTDVFQVILLDISMPNSNIFELVIKLKKTTPNSKIIVFSMADAKIFAMRLIKLGVDGYVEKQQMKTEIMTAINAVLEGRRHISENLMNNFLDEINNTDNLLLNLTNQEIMIVMYLIEGNTTKNIAMKLRLKPSSISTFKRRIMDKLNIKTIIDLAKMVEGTN